MEIELYNFLSFPYMLVPRVANGRLGHLLSWHVDRYFPSNLYHPSQNLSNVNSLVQRAISLFKANHHQMKYHQVSWRLQSNGYREQDIVGTIKGDLKFMVSSVTFNLEFNWYKSNISIFVSAGLAREAVNPFVEWYLGFWHQTPFLLTEFYSKFVKLVVVCVQVLLCSWR